MFMCQLHKFEWSPVLLNAILFLEFSSKRLLYIMQFIFYHFMWATKRTNAVEVFNTKRTNLAWIGLIQNVHTHTHTLNFDC